jgi:hypothetical protein
MHSVEAMKAVNQILNNLPAFDNLSTLIQKYESELALEKQKVLILPMHHPQLNLPS